MSKYVVKLQDRGRCHIEHQLVAAEIITDLPPEYGGSGQSFSSTDLVSAALGSCTLTSIDKILEREGFNPAKIRIVVIKTLSQNPKMIDTIRLDIFYPDKLSDVVLKKLEHASNTCPVKRSLNEKIKVVTVFNSGDDCVDRQ